MFIFILKSNPAGCNSWGGFVHFNEEQWLMDTFVFKNLNTNTFLQVHITQLKQDY